MFIEGFILGFVTSLLAGYVVYYFTVTVPRDKDRTNIKEFTSMEIRGLIGGSKIVFQTLFKEAGIPREFKDITLQDIRLMAPKVKLKAEAPPLIGFVIRKGLSNADYLLFYKEITVSSIQKLFVYIPFLDSELIKRLNRIYGCRYFILCDEWLRNVDLVTDPDLTAFDEDLYEYHEAVHDLEQFAVDSKIIEN